MRHVHESRAYCRNEQSGPRTFEYWKKRSSARWKKGRMVLHSMADRLVSLTVMGPSSAFSPSSILCMRSLRMESTRSFVCDRVCPRVQGFDTWGVEALGGLGSWKARDALYLVRSRGGSPWSAIDSSTRAGFDAWVLGHHGIQGLARPSYHARGMGSS